MKIKQVRNATVIIEYAGKRLLVDPWLAPQDSMGSLNDLNAQFLSQGMYLGMLTPIDNNNNLRMPISPLPEPVENILKDIDAYFITHLHPDHIDHDLDGTIGKPLNKETPIFIREGENPDYFKKSKFKDIKKLTFTGVDFGDIKIFETPARHGTVRLMGPACGMVFQSQHQPTVYVAGDTIYFDGVQETIERYKPEIIILNACEANFIDYGNIIMGYDDVLKVRKASPEAQIILTHFGAIPHALISRKEMKEFVKKMNIASNTFVPEDGETLEF